VICTWLAPATRADILVPIEWWGRIIEALIPNVSGWASITSFEPPAWFTLVILWTLLPFTTWWVARGDWMLREPNRELFRSRPWVLVLLGAIVMGIAALVAFLTPELSELTSGGRSSRTMRAAVSSRTSFGIYAGLVLSIVAMCLGVVPQLVRLWREATNRAD
jgi:hypothetical protein